MSFFLSVIFTQKLHGFLRDILHEPAHAVRKNLAMTSPGG